MPISFPYAPAECGKHRRCVVMVDERRVVKCSLCNAILDALPGEQTLRPRKIYTCVCGEEIAGSLASRVHRCHA